MIKPSVNLFIAGVRAVVSLDMRCAAICFVFVVVMVDDRVSRKVDFKISLVDGDLVFVAEDRSNLFQWQAIGVREVEPHEGATDDSWYDEAEVLFG